MIITRDPPYDLLFIQPVAGAPVVSTPAATVATPVTGT